MKSCGAKTRTTGKPCTKPGMENGRCRLHGGLTPKVNRATLKHGIYSKGLREEEKAIWTSIPIGSIDDEIRITKLQLRRALIAQAAVDASIDEASGTEDSDSPVGMELSQITEQPLTEYGGGKTVVRKRPDYRGEIYRLTGRIADLEKARVDLLKGGAPNDDHIEKIIFEVVRGRQNTAPANDGAAG